MLKLISKAFHLILILGFILPVRQAKAAHPVEPGANTVLEWQVQRIEDLHYLSESMGDHAALYDSLGVLHVAFGGDHLYYARCENTTCSVETVDPADYVGYYASLALDSLGRPHIAYYDAGIMDFCDDEKVKYAAWDGSKWTIQVVDEGCTGKYPSIALDHQGFAHISYFDEVSDELKLADWDGADWNTHSPAWLPGFEFSGYPSSLLVDEGGNLHLAFIAGHPGEAQVWYIKKSGDTWGTLVEVDEQTGASGLAMVVDKDNQPHISYNLRYLDAGLSNYVNKLRYARTVGSSWQAPVEIDDMDYLGWTAISVGTDGFPHVAYKADGAAAFVTKTSQGWEAPAAVPGTEDVQRMYLEHTPNNKMGLVYYAGGALQHKISSPPLFVWSAPSEIDATRWQGASLAMASNAAGDLHVVFSDFSERQIRYAYQPAGGDWEISALLTTTETAVLWDMDIALDSKGFPHIVYQEYNTSDLRSVLKYLQWSGTEWLDWGIVNQAGHNGCAPSLALNPSDLIYIAYNDCDYLHDNLMLASYDGSWSFETVDPDGNTSGASLQVTGDGAIHISYSFYNYPDSKVRYALKETGSSWVLTDVADAGPTGTSLALDSSGNPLIGYVYEAFPDYMAEFAYWDGLAWYTDTVSMMAIQSEAGLALDAQDRPHLVYAGWDGPSLAVKDGASWTLTEPVDRPPADPDIQMGRTQVVEIGLRSSGLPVIVYNGELDLKLAEMVEVEDTWWVFLPALER